MTSRDGERDPIARALAGRPPRATPRAPREAVMPQAELDVPAREPFDQAFALAPATALVERSQELGIDFEGRGYYFACLFDSRKPSAVALTPVSAGGGRLSGSTLALGLAAPNRWLAGRAPAEQFQDDQADVEHAAEMDGFPWDEWLHTSQSVYRDDPPIDHLPTVIERARHAATQEPGGREDQDATRVPGARQ